ncbi:hypothetical protein FNF27_00030 [Cafeteria roenbergensis]|uniref:DUF711 family protein n=1 Tax=Cafeteria roenbergensis TaxID=33653 RepID=A0A5A8EJM6_CAFRO|nr:hypothetical protein FNF27_00030 [Cafeteria roenbergensis]
MASTAKEVGVSRGELPVVRTITAFVSPATAAQAKALSAAAGAVLAACFARLSEGGYAVQTVRVALSPFESWLGVAPGVDDEAATTAYRASLAEAAAAALEAAKHSYHAAGAGDDAPGVLLTVGPASSPAGALAIPHLVRTTPGVTASADVGRARGADGDAGSRTLMTMAPSADPAMCRACAEVMSELATTTEDAAGNFQFAALARVDPCTPFFPAAFAPPAGGAAPADAAASAAGRAAIGAEPAVGGGATGRGAAALGPRVLVALGLQHLNITVPAAEAAAAADPAGHAQPAAVAGAVTAALRPHVRALQADIEAVVADPSLAAAVAAAHGGGAGGSGGAPALAYIGTDTSFAPNPSAPALDRLFRAAGVPHPGASGSLALASALTAACKTLGVGASARPLLVGYCGLMLPPLEDLGLASAVSRGQLTVSDLLSLSAVCGIGLDTVPVHVPGLFPDSETAGADSGAEGVAAAGVAPPLERVIGDVAAMAYRLGKPLSCRLFPYASAAGSATEFDHPHMCNTSVMALP